MTDRDWSNQDRSDTDRNGEFGAISLSALQRVRTLWIELEPLVTDTRYDDPIDPTELSIELADGVGGADAARFDVQWSDLDNYSFHHVDPTGVNWRFDRHPNTHSPEAHFHPPPDASSASADRSCIRVGEVSLVTRAVVAMWRVAYETGDRDTLNSTSNPP